MVKIFMNLYKAIMWATIICTPFIAYIVGMNNPNNYIDGFMVTLALLSVECIAAYTLDKSFSKKCSPVPKPSRRFTWKDSNGNVSINKSDLYEIIDYLYSLEEYLDE